MTYVMIHHRVEDYGKWKPIFDADGKYLKEAGCQGFELFKTEKEKNALVILLRFEDSEKARSFFKSERLKEAMNRAGVLGTPDIFYLEKLEEKKVEELAGEVKAA